MPILSAPIRRILAILLGLVLLGALWTTALTRLSDRATAVPLLTDAGIHFINPLLTANANGLEQSLFAQLQQQAAAHPDQSLTIPGIKVPVTGRDIQGKSFDQATRILYAKVATAYYDNGLNFTFNLPPQLQSALSSYDPFVHSSGASAGAPNVSIPQLPSFARGIYSAIGLNPTTLTAKGHSDVSNISRVLWILSGLLALALAFFSRGWARLRVLGWALFHSAWHIAALSLLAVFLVAHNAARTAPYQDMLGLIGNAFIPVYVGATVVGVLVVVGSIVAKRMLGLGRLATKVVARPAPALASRAPTYAPPPRSYVPGEQSRSPSTSQPRYPFADAPDTQQAQPRPSQYPQQQYRQSMPPQQPAQYPWPDQQPPAAYGQPTPNRQSYGGNYGGEALPPLPSQQQSGSYGAPPQWPGQPANPDYGAGQGWPPANPGYAPTGQGWDAPPSPQAPRPPYGGGYPAQDSEHGPSRPANGYPRPGPNSRPNPDPRDPNDPRW